MPGRDKARMPLRAAASAVPMTGVLHFGLHARKHRQATFGSIHCSHPMLLSSHQPLAACAAVAIAASLLISACGGGNEPRGLTTFQAASLVLGQTSLTGGQPNQGGSTSGSGFDAPMGMALTPEGGLLVADTGNSRVLSFSTEPRSNGAAGDAVLGQAGFEASESVVSRTGMHSPRSVSLGAGKMAIADYGANRVLIYDRIPVPGEPAPVPAIVIGQGDFESSARSCGPGGLHGPTAAIITPDGKLIVGDFENHRLLVWNQVPVDQTAARMPNLVLGQSDADHCAYADDNQDGYPDFVADGRVTRGTGRVMSPESVWSDGRRLVVSDRHFSRVLVWKTFPTTDFQPADLVLGQPDFKSIGPNRWTGSGDTPPPTAATLNNPSGVHSDGNSLAVADALNNRVLVWTTFPQINGQPADIVLGHPGFEHSATNDANGDGHPDAPTAQLLDRPVGVLFTLDGLFASDRRHHRVLKFQR